MAPKGGPKYETFARYPGVRAYLSPKKRTPDGKPGKCFYIRYKDSRGKLVEEKVGWLSEGVTASYASGLRAERIRSIRLGDEVVPIQKKRKQAITFNDFMEEKYIPWARTFKRAGKMKRGCTENGLSQ